MANSYSVFQELLDRHSVRASDVTKATGIRSSTFSDWKAGRYTPKLDKLQLIADYFGVNVDCFSGRSEVNGLAEEHRRSLNSLQTELALRDVLEESDLFKGVEFSKDDILDILKYIGYIVSQKEGVD